MKLAKQVVSLVLVATLATTAIGCGKPENAPSGFVPGGGGAGGC